MSRDYTWVIQQLKNIQFGQYAAFDETSFLHRTACQLLQSKSDLDVAIQQLDQGVPLAYVLQEVFFLDRTYKVYPGVFIPRPETELLVEHTKDFLDTLSGQVVGIEIGLGTGIISSQLLEHKKELYMYGSEFCIQAEKCAKENLHFFLSDRMKIHSPQNAQEVVEPFLKLEKVDFLVSNPPYLKDTSECTEQTAEFEPQHALFANPVNYFYEQIALKAPQLLKSNAALFLEIPHERAYEIEQLFSSHFTVNLLEDLTNRPRILYARLKA